MGVHAGPDINEDGLVLALDGANYRSFKGEATTNLISDPFALSGFPTPVSWSGYEATVTRTSSLPFGDMYNISSTWLQIDKTSSSNGRIAVLGVSGLQTGVDYCCSFYVYSNDTNLTNINWLSDNNAVSTIQSYTSYTSSDRNTIKRIQTIFRSVSGSQVNVLRISAGDPIGTRAFITGLQVEQKSYPTTVVNGTRGTTVATGGGWADLTGNGNNGQLVNGVRESADNLSYLSFDGTNDYITINQTLSTPFTISGFIRYTDQAKTLNTFINTSPHTVLGISLNRLGGGQLYVYIGNGSGWLGAPAIISSSNMLVNTWYQVTFTSTGSGSTLYLNGTSVGTSIYSPSGWGSTYYLGTIIIASGEYLKGNIATTQIYNRALTAEEIKQNYNSLKRRFILDGSTSDRAAPSASHLVSLGITTNGSYWLKPSGYSGEPEIVYIDFDGSESGITDSGPWVRVRYAQDYYSRAAAWSGQTGLTDPASENTTAFSGVFDYEQSYSWIDSLLDNSTEVRQIFESWGYGSVGWTYLGNSAYNEARGFDNRNYTRWGGNGGTHVGASGVGRVSGMSHSVTSINGPFDNPTANGTDPTDLNDAVWRVGVFYFRYTGDPATRKPLPIRGMYNADVDGATEQRYFPFRTGEASPGVNSDIWIKN